MNNTKKSSILSKNGVSYLMPFILITSCFALWGFANDITNPMVKAFSKIFRMSVTDGALVQVAFYGGYFAMAFPAAMFIRKFSYKAGVLLGLGMYAFGAFLFFPAMLSGSYYPFLIAYFILTCGLSFLETSSNPYILSMGTEETATRRLNLAQSFNPMGSLLGMYVAMNFIQNRLNPMDTMERSQLSATDFEAVRDSDLGNVDIDSYGENAEECRPVSRHQFLSDIETYLFYQLLQGRGDCPVLLCRCPDYVLDVCHTIWHTFIHVSGDGRKGGGSVVSAI